MNQDKFIQIDKEGYFLSEGLPVVNQEYGHHLLSNLVREERGRFQTSIQNQSYWVEAFDEPLVTQQIERTEGETWNALFPYGFKSSFELNRLSLDEWDRFHGLTIQGIPFVFSRAAQSEFFRLLDDYSDTSITVGNHCYKIPNWFVTKPEASKQHFWNQKYKENFTPWDLEEPAAALVDSMAQLKIPKSKILIPGCGTGNDAAYLAQQGHIVTAIDISPHAIKIAKQRYGNIPQLKFLEMDVFQLPDSFTGFFDLVFEHTCYCAINPVHRNRLLQVWKQVLVERGHLLGIFFTTDQQSGPPFGGSEWELNQRLQNHFEFLYWTRWRRSVPERQGAELVVYGQKL